MLVRTGWEDVMDRSISLAMDVDTDAATVFRAVSTTAGQRAFWTADCEVQENRARFGFVAAPVDLHVSVSTEAGPHARDLRVPVLGGLDLGMGDRRPGSF